MERVISKEETYFYGDGGTGFYCAECGQYCPCSNKCIDSEGREVCIFCYRNPTVPPDPESDDTIPEGTDNTDTPNDDTSFGNGGTGFICAECGEYCPCDLKCIDKDGREICMVCYRNPTIPPEPETPNHTGKFICTDCGGVFDVSEQNYVDPNTTVCNSCYVKYDRFICTECFRNCPCSKRSYDPDICYECYCKLPICPDCMQRVPSADRYDDKSFLCKTCGKKQEQSQKIPVESITLQSTQYALSPDESVTLMATIYPENATVKTLEWSSSDSDIASVEPMTGIVTGKRAGIATITAKTVDGGHIATCECWVKGKTPVFLIHGRTSNSFNVWGATNRIFVDPLNPENKNNNHFDPSITALSVGNARLLYTDKGTQDILSYKLGRTIKVNGVEDTDYTVPGVFNGIFTEDGEYKDEHPEGGNLAYKLKEAGYKENINLFVFNYPNEDAVVYSAQKFEKYIENLIDFVYNHGTDEMKACFFDSRDAYNSNDYKINIVGHSMGGLVARYYIENLYHDDHVDKLITICTPHWGSGYGKLSSDTDIQHKLCDHDLDFDSAMFGGTNSITVNCSKGNCLGSDYAVTPALQYSRDRSTRYYAIAGIDYYASFVIKNDHTLVMPTNFTTVDEITDFLVSNNVFKFGLNNSPTVTEPDPKRIGDNMVGFLSQIGWIGDNDNVEIPEPKIQMEKIFIDVDTDGGNGGETYIWEAIAEWLFHNKLLHSKIPHRIKVMEKTIEFLEE